MTLAQIDPEARNVLPIARSVNCRASTFAAGSCIAIRQTQHQSANASGRDKGSCRAAPARVRPPERVREPPQGPSQRTAQRRPVASETRVCAIARARTSSEIAPDTLARNSHNPRKSAATARVGPRDVSCSALRYGDVSTLLCADGHARACESFECPRH